LRLSQNLCKPILSDQTVMPGLTRHPPGLQGIAGQARNDSGFNDPDIYTKVETVSRSGLESALSRLSQHLCNPGPALNILARLADTQRSEQVFMLFDESSHPIGIGLAVFAQTPSDRFVDEEFGLS
jgi:hypothetical protein